MPLRLLPQLAARSSGNVEYWLKRQEFPSEHCPALERAYGIPCERLRGDVKWVRVPAVGWPKGKPLIDVLPARPAAKAA